MARHAIVLTLLIGVISAVLVVSLSRVQFTPVVASSQALSIDALFFILFAIAVVIFVTCFVLLVYSVIVFRRKPGDMEDGPPLLEHAPLEAIWTLIPLAIVIGLAVYGGLLLNDITRAATPERELEVKVSSFQWAWVFEYSEYGLTTTELRLPLNRPVLFKLTSRDVVHSFWVPEFRVKQDAVPGMETQLRVIPIQAGTYKVRCAEMCGLAHAYMVAPVMVVTQEDFDRWLAEEGSK